MNPYFADRFSEEEEVPEAEEWKPRIKRIVWVCTEGWWHLTLTRDAEGESGFLPDGREWKSAKKDFSW